MKIISFAFLVFCVAEVFAIDELSYSQTRSTLMKTDAKPAAGRIATNTVASLIQCSVLCTQNILCLKFAFNGTGCDLFEPAFPVPDAAWVSAVGYTTHKARPKIIKFIDVNYFYSQVNNACKNKFGGQHSSITDVETFQLLAQLQKTQGKCLGQDNGWMIGLRSMGRSGIFQWNNGETIDVVNGTGFQRWFTGHKPSLYKTGDVIVYSRACGKEFGSWVEMPAGLQKWVTCEVL